jgi:CRISPR/Cas system CSM-associated protein Csm3 (group 7 of RAMP superfamily)
MIYRIVKGILEARTAVHVGSGEGSEVADLLLRRDAEGDIVIPGTAIAGTLRALLTRLAASFQGMEVCRALWPETARKQVKNKGCGCAVCRLMGDVEPSDEGDGATAASRLIIFNARLLEGDLPMFRDSVGIDRRTGAAARQTAAKYDLEVIPAEARFELRIELREPSGEGGSLETDEQLLATALGEWRAGRLTLGGDVGRGLGAFTLTDLRYYERDLDTADGLMAFLRTSEPWKFAEDALPAHVQEVTSRLWKRLEEIEIAETSKVLDQAWKYIQGKCSEKIAPASMPVTTGWAAWEFTLQAKGPFLTHDTTTAGLRGFAHAPLLNQMDDWTHPVLPGSSLRGVLRSHAERIARTLASYCAVTKDDAEGYFLRHCPACDPLARRPEATDHHTALESCDSLLHYEVVHPENEEVPRENLCLACQLFGSARNGSRLRVEDAPFVGDKPVYKMLDFLAVDRFTGGGAEHLKFDALALWKPAFKVQLWLENPEDWELGWLILVLRDLAAGWLRVGFGAAKGFGEVEIAEGIFRRATLPAGKPPEGAESLFTITALPLDDARLRAQQQMWLTAFHAQLENLTNYRNSPQMELPADSYFGAKIAELYPLNIEQQGGAL